MWIMFHGFYSYIWSVSIEMYAITGKCRLNFHCESWKSNFPSIENCYKVSLSTFMLYKAWNEQIEWSAMLIFWGKKETCQNWLDC